PGDTVTATATDDAGNISSPANQIVIDTIAPSESAPTVSFEDAGEDGVYSQREVGEDGTITATVTMPEGTQAGDIVTINGVDYPVTTEILKDGQSIQVQPGDTVTASVKDTAGNETPKVVETAPAADESQPSAPEVTILGDTDNDGTLNSAEVGEDGEIEAEITIPEDAQAGDSVLITDAVGNTLVTYVVGENGVTAGSKQSIVISVTDGDVPVVKAEITDGNGVVATGQDTKVIDTAAPDNTTTGITLDSITDDNIVNALEAGKTIAVTGKVTGEFKAGDVVTLTTV
ncbi:hypothetical protein, partial [Psychrobacter sanguinis]|uniref:hypothetical protein n=1 Tax=Psychrobacter sanguinis TaxID=861445 RepID=UPI001396CB56